MATLTVFGVLGLGRFGYTVVLPSMQKGLGLSNTLAGSLATANLIGYAIMALVGGALASRFGTRIVIGSGLAVVAVSMGLTGFAHGFVTAALWRFITGLGSGLANVPATALVGAWFATRLRGVASGVVVTGSSIALIVVGPFAPRVMAAVGGGEGWRIVWWVYAAIAAVLAVGAFVLIRNRPSDMGLRPVGDEPPSASSPFEPDSLATQGDADAGVRETVRPLEWARVYRSGAIWHLGVVYFAFGLAYLSFMTFFTKHLVTTGGYTEQSAGDLYMLLGWCSILSGSLWGGISDRIGRKWALTLVYLFHALAFALFGLWETPVGFTAAAVIFGLSAWALPAIMAATCGDALGPRMAPAALGFITVFFAVGQAIGPAVAGAIADATGSFVTAFLLASGVAVLGSIASALLKPTVRSC